MGRLTALGCPGRLGQLSLILHPLWVLPLIWGSSTFLLQCSRPLWVRRRTRYRIRLPCALISHQPQLVPWTLPHSQGDWEKGFLLGSYVLVSESGVLLLLQRREGYWGGSLPHEIHIFICFVGEKIILEREMTWPLCAHAHMQLWYFLTPTFMI